MRVHCLLPLLLVLLPPPARAVKLRKDAYSEFGSTNCFTGMIREAVYYLPAAATPRRHTGSGRRPGSPGVLPLHASRFKYSAPAAKLRRQAQLRQRFDRE